ncbi:glyoxylate/hydroxypyruvate reductase A [Dichotomicrobium thermohalophilum]|uniref:Glyoxylate/hydroxypyruvate reductase A n=2 Tax=Dichotomicrobium thermohalophilum TaxID=933063 RepID=A0A397QDW7_9HYPH|nr:glyoxylate/hydroxypyruvate reductase A [Dichotomicrobium thermohalophilum]RIA56274.1 glyoxylate/hydroxypyruvate reductase A [Dichotomicrobium thermohalophilum]
MAILLLISDMDPEEWDEAITRLAQQRRVRVWPYLEDPAEIEYAIVWKPPRGALQGFPNLRAIFSMGAGVDHLVGDPDLPDVPIVRFVADDLTEQMSEYVLHHVLLHHRRHLEYAEQQARKVWNPLPQPTAREVRVGVMGCGVLGSAAAAKLGAIGFQTRGWSRTRKDIPGVTTYAGSDEFLTFLGGTDILVCLLPLTPQTRGLLGGKLIAAMAPDGALPGRVIINAGRGGLQNEAEILAALEDGTLWAASLDVFETEPLPESSPLWRHPRVVVTPHNAAVSRPEPLFDYVLDQIQRFERGEGLDNVVDVQRGY